MLKLVHDVAAENDLIEIWLYTNEQWGIKQADVYLGLLERGVLGITKNPNQGLRRDVLRAGYWSLPVEHHIVFYTFNENEVRVRRVLHEVMDVGRHV